MDGWWAGRGVPWEFDPGPPRNRSWARLFAETPNYRGLGRAVTGREAFRWHFGPMFYRGRLTDGGVKVLIIGQEGAQDESLAARAFVGGTGARMQHLLAHLGITRSYLFLNTFVYPIFGQYTGDLRWLAQDSGSPIVAHRHAVLDYVTARNDLRLVIAVGTAAKETVVTWVRAHGGQVGGPADVDRADPSVLGPRVRLVGVVHPGAAAQGGAVAAILRDFRAAIAKVERWERDEPGWLPPDPDGTRLPADDFRYRSAPIPFRDLPYGTCWRLGRGGTSSNRANGQRAIQLFAAGGSYNAAGDRLVYGPDPVGDTEGYLDDEGDLAYEPPRRRWRDFDNGPPASLARLLQGGAAGLPWPDFAALGVGGDGSFGWGPAYRGRFTGLRLIAIADQQSHDDLFCGRALCGAAGQHLQGLLETAGVAPDYLVVRTLPVESLELPAATVRAAVDHPQTVGLHQELLSRLITSNPKLRVVLAIGPHARRLVARLPTGPLPVVELRAWRQSGARADWTGAFDRIRTLVGAGAATWDGRSRQIPRFDLPYGSLRWRGTSGDRALRPRHDGRPSQHYLKLFMPGWAASLAAAPLSRAEQAAVDSIS